MEKNKIIFKPSPAIPLVLTLVIFGLIGYVLIPQAYSLHREYGSQDTLEVLAITLAGTFLPLLFFIPSILINAGGKKIQIDGKLLAFEDKPLFGPAVLKIVNLDNIERIDSKKKVYWAFIGRGLVIVRYWLVFLDKNKHQEDISLSGWDLITLKKVVLCLRERYPQIKWNTHLYRDDSTKLSGIDKLLANSRHKQTE